MDGLTLSPLRTEIEILPGKSVKGSLKIVNATDDTMTVRMNAEAFRIVDKNYNYAFNQNADVIKWVTFKEQDVVLKARESKQMQYTIAIPMGAKPGGRYISMFATTDVKSPDGAINARQRVGSLFYLTVIGEMKIGGILTSVHSPLWVGGNSRWSMTVRNDETTHFRTNYSMTIHSIINDRVLHKSTGNALIMPDTEREIINTLNVPRLPGIYKMAISVDLGEYPSRHDTRLLVYVPLWMWGGIVFIIIIKTILVMRRHRA